MNERRRDLSLVLLGAALVRAERERVLGLLPAGTVDESIAGLVSGMAGRNFGPIRHWLSERGVETVAGCDVIERIAATLRDERTVRHARRMVSELQMAAKIEDVAALAARLRECLDIIEGEDEHGSDNNGAGRASGPAEAAVHANGHQLRATEPPCARVQGDAAVAGS